MTTFFTNLAAGQTKVNRLRNVQPEMIEYGRGKYSAYPFFHPAITVTRHS